MGCGRYTAQLMLSHQTFGGARAAAAERDIKWVLHEVGLYNFTIQLTHSLKAPGFNP
jgi:hypothetical protein